LTDASYPDYTVRLVGSLQVIFELTSLPLPSDETSCHKLALANGTSRIESDVMTGLDLALKSLGRVHVSKLTETGSMSSYSTKGPRPNILQSLFFPWS